MKLSALFSVIFTLSGCGVDVDYTKSSTRSSNYIIPADLSKLPLVDSKQSSTASALNENEYFMPPSVMTIHIENIPFYLHPDCSLFSERTIIITGAPRHGSVAIKPARIYPNTNNRDAPVFKCITKSLLVKTVFYTKEVGFIGDDSFTFDIYDPFGQVSSYKWNIHVR